MRRWNCRDIIGSPSKRRMTWADTFARSNCAHGTAKSSSSASVLAALEICDGGDESQRSTSGALDWQRADKKKETRSSERMRLFPGAVFKGVGAQDGVSESRCSKKLFQSSQRTLNGKSATKKRPATVIFQLV